MAKPPSELNQELLQAIRKLGESSKPAKVPPNAWLSKWMGEESFWRELFTRSVSGLLVVYISFLLAALLGIIKTTPTTDIVSYAIVALVFLGLFIPWTVKKGRIEAAQRLAQQTAEAKEVERSHIDPS